MSYLEAPYDDKVHPGSPPGYHQHGSSDTITPVKPVFNVSEYDPVGRQVRNRVPDRPPQVFYLRTLVLIFIPVIITIYFAIIWIALLENNPIDDAVKYRTYSGSLVFYSWFVVGIFGMAWSRFGLLGVEVTMLSTPFWVAPSLVALIKHSNSTWASPSGWVRAIWRREFSLLWSVFMFLSVIPFIAFPLSGLVFEISDGYIEISDVPSVLGRNSSTFNTRYDGFSVSNASVAPARAAWLIGAAPAIPGFGVIFSSESVDRSQHEGFEELPNSLPLAAFGSESLFLAPQADKPVSGSAWGILFKYDCSIVRSASQFTILSQKSASSVSDARVDKLGGPMLKTPSGDVISLWNSVTSLINTQAYFEVGISAEPEKKTESLKNLGDKYTGEHPGFEYERVFEYAAWQVRTDGLYEDHLQPFNTTLDDTIDGMGSPFFEEGDGRFALNNTFFTIKGVLAGSKANHTTDASSLMSLKHMIGGSSDGKMLYAAPPIGIRCVSASELGVAEMDGVTSTFRNFTRIKPVFDTTKNGVMQGSLRFGRNAEYMLNGEYHQHYLSGGLPGTTPGQSEEQRRYSEFVDSKGLLRSVSLAYANDATNLIYDQSSAFKQWWPEKRLKSSRKGKILSYASLIKSRAMGYFVLSLLCIWSSLSAVLGVMYGFRKRPSDRLDGYMMLRLGAENGPELIEDADFMNGIPYQDSQTMAAMPGNVSVRNG